MGTLKAENDENVPRLEITEVIEYSENSRGLCILVPNKSFGQLLGISPEKFDSEFSYIEVWFTDPNSKPLQTKDKTNITLVVNQSVQYKNDWLFS